MKTLRNIIIEYTIIEVLVAVGIAAPIFIYVLPAIIWGLA